jgi:hypothetical protein
MTPQIYLVPFSEVLRHKRAILGVAQLMEAMIFSNKEAQTR